jgi:hypothetical protein
LRIRAHILRPQGQRRVAQQARRFLQVDEGGQMTQVACSFEGAPASSSSMSRAFSVREPCIFQFPATMGRRMERPITAWKPPTVFKGRAMIAMQGG